MLPGRRIRQYEPLFAEFSGRHLPTVAVPTYYGSDQTHLVPVIDHPDARILREVERSPERWDMQSYADGIHAEHPCSSAHCMAGWLVHICGIQGYELMLKTGYDGAAALIYEASCPGKDIPSFEAAVDDDPSYRRAYNADHLELLRKRAAADPLPAE